MQAYRDPPHYLRPLTTTRTPQRLLWLDVASTTVTRRGALVAEFYAAALGTTHYTRRKQLRKDSMTTYQDPQALWSAADEFCTQGRRVVLFAYDLAHQIRISQAMLWLPRMGWSLETVVLERTAAWALYRDNARSLMLCDLKSWCPVDLGVIASDLTHGRVRAMDVGAGPQFRPEVCTQRATCVRDAMMQVFNWIEGENLGPFRPTGSGQSYSAYRRKYMHHKLLVHDDTSRLEAERAAMWTGRCEAWAHGKLSGGPFHEYDMTAAYCTIASQCEVPTIAQGEVRQPTLRKVERAMQQYAVLAHITVTTDVECVPTRVGGRTCWPVGTFDTWVWDPELQLAIKYARDIKVHQAYRYLRAPALQEFSQWVLDGLGPQTQVYGQLPKRVLKHWSRCLVGRLGLRYRSWQKFAHDDDMDLRLVTFLDMDENTSTDMLIAGHEWLLLSDMTEALESLPQVPSWVMSECRRRLWEAMTTVGAYALVYVDTDSIIVRASDALTWSPEMFGSGVGTWSHKGTYRRMVIHGPRNLVCETDRRISGVPLTAKQTAPLEFTGQVMRSIKESMRAGELDRVTTIPRKFVLDAPDLRRQHLLDGKTAPYQVQPIQPQEDS